MPVNEHLTSYDLTSSNNTPAGASAVGSDLDDHLRDIKKNAYKASLANTLAKSAGYEATISDHGSIILCDATAGTVTISIGAASGLFDGWRLGVACVSSTNGATLDPSTTETVDGTASISIAAGQVRWVVCDGSNFRTYATHYPTTSVGANLLDSTDNTSARAALGIGTLGGKDAVTAASSIAAGSAGASLRINAAGTGGTLATPEVWVVTAGSSAAVTALDLNSVFSSGYDYELQLEGVQKAATATGRNLHLKLSTDGGSTYLTTGITSRSTEVLGSPTVSFTASQAYALLTNQSLVTDATLTTMRVYFQDPAASGNIMGRVEASVVTPAPSPNVRDIQGWFYVASTAANSLRVELSTATDTFNVDKFILRRLARAKAS